MSECAFSGSISRFPGSFPGGKSRKQEGFLQRGCHGTGVIPDFFEERLTLYHLNRKESNLGSWRHAIRENSDRGPPWLEHLDKKLAIRQRLRRM